MSLSWRMPALSCCSPKPVAAHQTSWKQNWFCWKVSAKTNVDMLCLILTNTDATITDIDRFLVHFEIHNQKQKRYSWTSKIMYYLFTRTPTVFVIQDMLSFACIMARSYKWANFKWYCFIMLLIPFVGRSTVPFFQLFFSEDLFSTFGNNQLVIQLSHLQMSVSIRG